jgi:hypothetical protein
MAEPWEGVGEAAMAEPTRHKRGLLGGCDAHAGIVSLYLRVATICLLNLPASLFRWNRGWKSGISAEF